jgi:hypothetical protein
VSVPSPAVPGTHWVSAIGRHSGLGAQAAFTVRTDWAAFRFASRHKGLNPFENVLSPYTVSGLDVDWSGATSNAVESSPAVLGGVVYVGSDDGKLYAFPSLVRIGQFLHAAVARHHRGCHLLVVARGRQRSRVRRLD